MVKRLIDILALALMLGFAGGASANLGTLTAWFPLDDNAATTEVNEKVGNVDGTMNENTNLHHSDDRVFGTGSLIFDGVDDNVVTSDNAAFDFGTGSFTITTWVKTTDTNFDLLFKFGATANYYLRDVSGWPEWDINFTRPDASTVKTSSSVSTGAWVHLTVVRNREYDPGTGPAPRLEIWIGGVLKATAADVSGSLDNEAVMKFGWTTYTGKMDDLGFYRSALTSEEINWVKDHGVGTPVPEPGTMLLAGFGVLVLLLSRRKR